MVVLITTNDLYYELKCPGVTTIGRGSSNDVIPESRSISKSHATLTINLTTHGKLEMWIEDLDSTNGTYAGSSALDIHRISGKEKVEMGDYLRFGHSSQYFKIQKFMAPGTGTLSIPLDRPDSPPINVVDVYTERDKTQGVNQNEKDKEKEHDLKNLQGTKNIPKDSIMEEDENNKNDNYELAP